MNNQPFILVLDDDPDIGAMIKLMLEYRGYTVDVTDRAEKIDELMKSKPISLLIMDMLLSGVNGTDICRQIKQDPTTSSLSVLMISAHPNAKQICLDAGADDFIGKPFDMQDLYSRIDTLVK